MTASSSAVEGLDLDGLRAKAQKATPGPWRVGHPSQGQRWFWTDHGTGFTTRIGGATDKADVAFIVATDPSTVLALIARVEAAEAAVARVRTENVRVPRGALTERIAAALDAAL